MRSSAQSNDDRRIKVPRALTWLLPAIFVLTAVAALAGLWPADGTSYALTSFRGEEVTINARGLYYWDTVSMAAQMRANDLIALVVGLPLLAISYRLTLRGSLRGRIVLAGTLGFILYTYMTMVFGAHYNGLFLVYVALFGLSLFSFVMVLLSFDLNALPSHFSDKLPRGWIASLLFFIAAFLSLAWLGRILPTIAGLPVSEWQAGGVAGIPALENTTSMFIQAMDLGVIVPTCVLSGVLLLRRHPWGYLLASVGLLKFLTLGIAVALMGLNMARVGVPISPVQLGVFLGMACAGAVMTVILLKHVSAGGQYGPTRSAGASRSPPGT
jgi:hypothetical protein